MQRRAGDNGDHTQNGRVKPCPFWVLSIWRLVSSLQPNGPPWVLKAVLRSAAGRQ